MGQGKELESGLLSATRHVKVTTATHLRVKAEAARLGETLTGYVERALGEELARSAGRRGLAASRRRVVAVEFVSGEERG